MLQQPRLPYVRFSCEAVETKDEDGHPVFTNKYFANIVPAGGKDEVVKEAESWLIDLRKKGETRGPFDSAANEYQTWYQHFSKLFDQYKAGEEMTMGGTPLRAILAFTKAEIAQAESVRIYSLENLAAANEEELRNMGIGARAMKDKAVQVLSAKGDNRMAEENAALRAKVERLEARLEEFIEAGIQPKRSPGRPKKEPESA